MSMAGCRVHALEKMKDLRRRLRLTHNTPVVDQCGPHIRVYALLRRIQCFLSFRTILINVVFYFLYTCYVA